MSPRRLVWAAAGVAIAMLAAGCQTSPPSSTATASAARPGQQQPSTAPVAQFTEPHPAEPAEPDANAALPETLSKKTAEYARSMEPPAHQAQPTNPSSVQWGQPHGSAATGAATPAVPQQLAAANTAAALPASPHRRGRSNGQPMGSNSAIPTGDQPPASPAQVAALARSAGTNPMSDVPVANVPESSDFADTAHPAAAVMPPDAIESQIAQRVKQDPHDVAAQLDSQLLLMMQDKAAPQLASLSTLSTEDQELVNTLVDGLTNFRTAVRQDENMLLANKIRPLLDMADRLRSQAELTVPTVALCTSVTAFGTYNPINPARFPAGRDNPVLVYCEVQNFASRHNNADQWETDLTMQVTLFTDTGMLVWKDKASDIKDDCRNRRHDFFSYDLVHLPANLTIGRYIMKVTVVDRTANRVAEKTIPIEITAGDNGNFAGPAPAGAAAAIPLQNQDSAAAPTGGAASMSGGN